MTCTIFSTKFQSISVILKLLELLKKTPTITEIYSKMIDTISCTKLSVYFSHFKTFKKKTPIIIEIVTKMTCTISCTKAYKKYDK